MTPSSRLLRMLTVAALAAASVMPGAAVALANGIGDLYVGQPAGVVEIYLRDEKVETTVDALADPTTLAFWNDGTRLYAGDGRKQLVLIDIESLEVANTFTLTEDVPAIAHPKGDTLYLAVPSQKALSLIADGDTAVKTGPGLEGAADLLAADRRDYHVVAAKAGDSWVDVVDSVDNTVAKVAVDGKVVGVTVAAGDALAYIATTRPNAVVAVSLTSGTVSWTAPLEKEPTHVTWVGTESPYSAIVDQGKELWRASKPATGTPAAVAWSTLEQQPGTLATSDEGGFVYAATKDGVTTVSLEKPTAQPPAEVALAKEPPVLAPVPKDSSLSKASGEPSANGNGNGGQSGTGGSDATNPPAPTKAPATDTDGSTEGRFHPAGPDPLVLFGGAALIALIVVAGMRGALARWMREP